MLEHSRVLLGEATDQATDESGVHGHSELHAQSIESSPASQRRNIDQTFVK